MRREWSGTAKILIPEVRQVGFTLTHFSGRRREPDLSLVSHKGRWIPAVRVQQLLVVCALQIDVENSVAPVNAESNSSM